MLLQKLINEGIPEHILADGIVHVWLYMAGSKKERDEKGRIFNQRFQLSGLDSHGKELTDYVKGHLNESLVWASENLTEYLPEELKSEYLDHYLKFCTTSKTLWLGEFYIIQYLSELFEIHQDGLFDKLDRQSEFNVPDLNNEENYKGLDKSDFILVRDQVCNQVKKLRNRFHLPTLRVLHEEKQRKEPPPKSPKEPVKKHTPKETESKQEEEQFGDSTADDSESTSDELDKIFAIVFVILFIILIGVAVYEYERPDSSGTANNQPSQSQLAESEQNTRSNNSNLSNQSSATAFTPKFVNRYVINKKSVRTYSQQNTPLQMLPAGSVYRVVSENYSMVTLELGNRIVRAYKSNFEDYETLAFTPRFQGDQIVSTQQVPLRITLSYASHTDNVLLPNRRVALVEETATSVRIRDERRLYWADKSNFNEYRVPEVEVEHINEFVDLVMDANVRRSPSIFADIEFEMKRGETLLVVGRVTGTMFYEVSISGERYYVSDVAIRL